MLDASIPLSVRPPEIASPLQTIGGLMQLRGQMSEIALHNQQIETSRQQAADIAEQTAQRHRQNESQAKLAEVLQDPSVHSKIRNGDLSPLYNSGASPDVINGVAEGLNKYYQTTGALRIQDAERHKAGRDMLASALANVDPANPATADQLNSFKAILGKDYPDLAQQLPTFSQGPQLGQQIDDLKKSNGIFTAVLDSELKTREERAKAVTAETGQEKGKRELAGLGPTGLTPLQQAELPGKEAQSKIEQAKADLFAHPEKGLAAIDVLSTPGSHLNAGMKAAYQAATTPEARQQILEQGVREQGEKDPEKIAAHVNQAVATAVGTHLAIAKLSPDAFAGIADATSRNSAMNEADKIYKEYTDKNSQTQVLLDTIRAAQGGNKAAPGVLPIEQVRSVLANGRINSQELRAVSSNAGSLMDQIEGKIGKLVSGQPIPADILQATAELAKIQQQAARRNFDAGKDRLKMRGVDTGKLPEPGIASSSAIHAVGDTVMVRGKKVRITAIHPDGTFDGDEVNK